MTLRHPALRGLDLLCGMIGEVDTMERAERNETAFVLSFVFGLFAVCGIAHLYQGKIKEGLVWMFIKGLIYQCAKLKTNLRIVVLR